MNLSNNMDKRKNAPVENLSDNFSNMNILPNGNMHNNRTMPDGNGNDAYVPPHLRGSRSDQIPSMGPPDANFNNNRGYGRENVPGYRGQQGHYQSQNSGYNSNRFNNNPNNQGNHVSNDGPSNNGYYNNGPSSERFSRQPQHQGYGQGYKPQYNEGNLQNPRFDQRQSYSGGNHQRANQHDSGNPCDKHLPSESRVPGFGYWDSKIGHVIGKPCPELETQLFASEHVSTGINFNKYDDIPTEATGPNVPPAVNSFEAANLNPILSMNIKLASYSVPTPVQKLSLPIVKNGIDLMACAQTGSGKTAGFLFPILDDLFNNGPRYTDNPCSRSNDYGSYSRCNAYPSALVIAPTRELCLQIYEEARRFTYRSWVKPVAVYGGIQMTSQLYTLRPGCHLLVATPGRLIDLINRGAVSLNHVRYLILDEADRMLDMGFEPQIRQIVDSFDLPGRETRTTLMFSATFPRQIQQLAADFLKQQYIFITVGRVGSASNNVVQGVIEVREEEKREFLLDILGNEYKKEKTLIFVETKRSADDLAYFLDQRNYLSTSIHGNRDQRAREEALEAFRSGDRPILVATAVAARGLDIPNVAHVINYDLPNDIDDYVHRIGRTGRAGNTGKSTAFFDRYKNYGVAEDLIRILTEAGQLVPEFLTAACSRSSFGRYGSGSGRPNNRGGRPRGNNMRDFRRDANPHQHANNNNNSINSSSNNKNNSMGGGNYGGFDGNRGGSSGNQGGAPAPRGHGNSYGGNSGNRMGDSEGNFAQAPRRFGGGQW